MTSTTTVSLSYTAVGISRVFLPHTSELLEAFNGDLRVCRQFMQGQARGYGRITQNECFP